MKRIVLKPKKDIPVRAGHPWIFSEAILQDVYDVQVGECVEVYSSDGTALGIGYHNGKNSIRVRIVTLNMNEAIDVAFFCSRFCALDAWKKPRLPEGTTGYRLVHAEVDGIPGLIIDRYENNFVIQFHTAGIDACREFILRALIETFHPSSIVERQDVEFRRSEGLNVGGSIVHMGDGDILRKPITFIESYVKFSADILNGQKTGFFLDQRNARMSLQKYVQNKRVLNLFSYTGGFSVYAALGGAAYVMSVDSSHPALEMAEQHVRLNGFDPRDEKKFGFLDADIFRLMEEKSLPGGPYDIIVCDPPALAKSAATLPQAIKAYTTLNTACISRLSTGGILFSSSCSGRLTPEDFRGILRHAAGRAKKDIRVIDWLGQPIDHGERLAFPEGRYLKTAILEVL